MIPQLTECAGSLWTVQKATHKTNGKGVSIWTFNKDALAGASKTRGKLEAAIDVLKKEVSLDTCQPSHRAC